MKSRLELIKSRNPAIHAWNSASSTAWHSWLEREYFWPWNVYVAKATTSKGIVSLGYRGWANQISLISRHLFGVINYTRHAMQCYMYLEWMTRIPQSGHLFRLNIFIETQTFLVLLLLGKIIFRCNVMIMWWLLNRITLGFLFSSEF